MKNLSWKVLLLGNVLTFILSLVLGANDDATFLWLIVSLFVRSHLFGVFVACYARQAPALHAGFGCFNSAVRIKILGEKF